MCGVAMGGLGVGAGWMAGFWGLFWVCSLGGWRFLGLVGGVD